MKARDVMTRNPEVVLPEEGLDRAAEIMERLDVGIVPVVDDRTGMRLRGVITDRDIAIRHVAKRHQLDCRVRDHMTADHLDVVHPDTDVHDVVGRMAHDQLRRIPVTEDGHRLVGIIAQADIARRVGPGEPREVEEMLQRISEPRPERQP